MRQSNTRRRYNVQETRKNILQQANPEIALKFSLQVSYLLPKCEFQ